MRSVVLASLLLAGCNVPPATEVVVPDGPAESRLNSAMQSQLALARDESAQKSQLLQRVSGDVYGVQNAAGFLPPGNPTTAVKEQAQAAAQKLPPPTAEQRLDKERQNTLFLSGQLEAARRELAGEKTKSDQLLNDLGKTTQALSNSDAEVARLRKEAAVESAQAKRSLQQLLDQKNAEIQRAKDEAYAQRNALIFWVLNGLGAVCALAAVALAVVTQGRELVRAGIALLFGGAFFGLAKTISSPWFLPVCWAIVGLGVLAAGLYLYVERRNFHSSEALQRTVKAVEKLKTEAPEEAKKVLATLGVAYDEAHKALVDRIRKA